MKRYLVHYEGDFASDMGYQWSDDEPIVMGPYLARNERSAINQALQEWSSSGLRPLYEEDVQAEEIILDS